MGHGVTFMCACNAILLRCTLLGNFNVCFFNLWCNKNYFKNVLCNTKWNNTILSFFSCCMKPFYSRRLISYNVATWTHSMKKFCETYLLLLVQTAYLCSIQRNVQFWKSVNKQLLFKIDIAQKKLIGKEEVF